MTVGALGIIVVAGAVAQRPGVGGHAWVFLQYLLGFRRLGYEVLFVDRLTPETLEPAVPWPPGPRHPQVRWLREVMGRHGLGDAYALLLGADRTAGRPWRDVVEHVRAAEVVLDVNGFGADDPLLAEAARPVYLDIDPGFAQIWHAAGLHDAFGRHAAYATVGLRVGHDGCALPSCGIDWVPTLPPVVLDRWPAVDRGDAYTTVAAWRGPFGPLEHDGRRYGLRAHQLRRFAALPRRTGTPLELALDIDPADAADREQLRRGGWRLVDPRRVAGTPGEYRSYVQRSRGELMVAKDVYVRSRCGWFSDRSVAYLASGKPVLAQATGFEDGIPTGEGLVAFATPEDALAGLEAIEGRYPAHAAAARELAAEHFDSDRVLARLLQEVAG